MTGIGKVLLFGVGSLGSNFAMDLSRRLGGDVMFSLVDFDTIEDVNRHNQLWFDVNVGQHKASVMSAFLFRVSDCVSNYYVKKIESSVDAITIIERENPTVVVDCFDNSISRYYIQTACGGLVDVLHSGFSESGYMMAWGKDFKINPKDPQRDPICDRRDMACLIQVAAARTADLIYLYLTEGMRKKEFGTYKNCSFKIYS